MMSLLKPYSSLINFFLLSFKLSTSKLFSERERSPDSAFSGLQLSSPCDATLICAMSQGCALQVTCGTSDSLSFRCSRKVGAGF